MMTANTNGAAPPFTHEAIPPTTEQPRLTRLVDLLDQYEAEATAAHEAYTTGKARGPQTGFKALDKELNGAYDVGVHVVHGNTGAGKTAFCWQVCATSTFPSLFITTEVSPIALLRRQAARVTNTYASKFKSGELPPAQAVALVRQGAAAAPLLTLADATTAYASPEWIENAALAARGDSKQLLIVVDSIHSWTQSAPGNLSEYDALSEGIAALRRLSSRLNCPIIFIAERSRAAMEKGGVNAGAGNRGIEYKAETVLSLTRDKDTAKTPTGDVIVLATLEKNRDGGSNQPVRLKFNGGFMRFTEA